MTRPSDLQRFYDALGVLEKKIGGARLLADCSGRMAWPSRGVYFFTEDGEVRDDAAKPRIVRVGTHALRQPSKQKLWGRLRQHRGHRDGNGNHRGSVFRQHVGQCLISQGGRTLVTWGKGHVAGADVRVTESDVEREVSQTIGAMPVLWLEIDDDPGPASLRGYVERNSIGLLSNEAKSPIDPPSAGWLGHFSANPRVRASGLWNSNHVSEQCAPEFLAIFEKLVDGHT